MRDSDREEERGEKEGGREMKRGKAEETVRVFL